MSRLVVHNYVHCDAAPDWFVESQKRQAAFKIEADAGIARCNALMDRVKIAQRRAKKSARTLTPGRSSGAEQAVKMARAAYGLAINNLNDKFKREEWFDKAKQDERQAVEYVDAMEQDVARDGSGAFMGAVRRRTTRDATVGEVVETTRSIPGVPVGSKVKVVEVTKGTSSRKKDKFGKWEITAGYDRIKIDFGGKQFWVYSEDIE